jgi:tRNA G18 (ribose-2'-O)-methylase SpoU
VERFAAGRKSSARATGLNETDRPEKATMPQDQSPPSTYPPPPPSWPPRARGYFAIGAERMSKSLNLGNLMRSAHAFGASFTFTIGARYSAHEAYADTSRSQIHMPHYNWDGLDEMAFPKGVKLVGIELVEGAIDLPSFRHPQQAAYVLGPERGSLSDELLERCDYVVKIPTSFCVNVAMAGAIVMYDRVKSLARFADRPIHEGGPAAPLAPVSHAPLGKSRKS